MSLPLPPKGLIRCDEATAQTVRQLLTSVIAGYPQATTPSRFYEEIDAWLGPWEQKGYPIAYGKFYNIAFSSNARLKSNAAAKQWVWKATIKLQEALRDYLVKRVKDCSIRSLTEKELRKAAFDSHATAYDDAGLGMIALIAPDMSPIIVSIPLKEFCPTSENFSPTVRQSFEAAGLAGPRMAGTLLAAAMPAHSQLFRRAGQMDFAAMKREFDLGRWLAAMKDGLGRGEFDYIPLLDQMIVRLNATEFPDEGFARAAREIVELAEGRKQQLTKDYGRLLRHAPEIRKRIQEAQPGVLE